MKQTIAEAETGQSVNEVFDDKQKSPGILQALLDFIVEQDALTGDPQFQHLKYLFGSESVPGEPVQLTSRSTPRETVVVEPKILHNPQVATANETYVGKNHQFLKVQPGDSVTVHAWIGEAEVIGFNERNHTAGRIPIEYLDIDEQQDHKHQNQTFLSGKNFSFFQDWENFLVWKPGDRIRVCCWDNALKMNGTGFSIATGQIGRFSSQ